MLPTPATSRWSRRRLLTGARRAWNSQWQELIETGVEGLDPEGGERRVGHLRAGLEPVDEAETSGIDESQLTAVIEVEPEVGVVAKLASLHRRAEIGPTCRGGRGAIPGGSRSSRRYFPRRRGSRNRRPVASAASRSTSRGRRMAIDRPPTVTTGSPGSSSASERRTVSTSGSSGIATPSACVEVETGRRGGG